MKLLVSTIIIFVTSLLVLEMVFYAYKVVRYPNLGKTRRRLKALITGENEPEPVDLTSVKTLSSVPMLDRLFMHLPKVKYLIHLQEQANVKYPLGVFILSSMVIGLTGYLSGFLIFRNYVSACATGLFICGIPFYYLLLKKKIRIEKFQRQFPEGLELIARALKAGHAITSGMALAAEEFDDPLGGEFSLVIDEINFGSSITDALKNFAERIGCLEVKYFVVSLIIQRESGGNLAEIIENIAHVIRERFKLQGKIRALSGEGKISAIILIALPMIVITAFKFMNPGYINELFSHPLGRLMTLIAGIMMTLGVLVMKKMINIKV